MVQIKKARYRYAVENQGLVPGAEQLADLLQWERARVDAALKGFMNMAVASLDYTDTFHCRKGDSPPLIGRFATPASNKDPENQLYQHQLNATITTAMRGRDPQRARITRLRYGLEDGIEWTYPQVLQNL